MLWNRERILNHFIMQSCIVLCVEMEDIVFLPSAICSLRRKISYFYLYRA